MRMQFFLFVTFFLDTLFSHSPRHLHTLFKPFILASQPVPYDLYTNTIHTHNICHQTFFWCSHFYLTSSLSTSLFKKKKKNTHKKCKMNEYYRDDRIKCCNVHPKMPVVGVCALCLNERLLILASKQAHLHQINRKNSSSVAPKQPSKSLPKIFALTNLLNRLDIKHQKTEAFCSSSTSDQDDSFISIKFEENGVASWDKCKISKVPMNDEIIHKAKGIKSVVEHVKPLTTLRWRRRIGHLFQVLRWKRSSKGNMCHVGTKLEGAKVKYGWIRTLTKRT